MNVPKEKEILTAKFISKRNKPFHIFLLIVSLLLIISGAALLIYCGRIDSSTSTINIDMINKVGIGILVVGLFIFLITLTLVINIVLATKKCTITLASDGIYGSDYHLFKKYDFFISFRNIKDIELNRAIFVNLEVIYFIYPIGDKSFYQYKHIFTGIGKVSGQIFKIYFIENGEEFYKKALETFNEFKEKYKVED